MDLRKDFYHELDYDKIKINWNKNPIKMDLFLSFLTIDVERIKDHLGSDTGWTKLINDEHELTVGGGYVNGVEWLDSLRYKKDLHNLYNNWVTPFNMFNILTKEGKDFFFEYYKDDIEKIRINVNEDINNLKEKLRKAKERKKEIYNEIDKLNDFEKIEKA